MPPRPPLADTIKVEANWVQSFGRTAHNIYYLLTSSAPGGYSATNLVDIANALMPAYDISGHSLIHQLSDSWSLVNITCSDNTGHTDNQGTSTVAALTGGQADTPFPPQVAVCVSWNIDARYRGGHPRWYLPGCHTAMLSGAGDSKIQPSFANALLDAANTLQGFINAATVDTFTMDLGTVSFSSGGTPRPTPVFRLFGNARVHERLDSQRRRSGKESAFPVVP